jgi:hypothetical protein
VAETTCVKGDVLESKCSTRGDTVSGSNSEYCGDVECRIDVKPFSLERIWLNVPTEPYKKEKSTSWLWLRRVEHVPGSR